MMVIEENHTKSSRIEEREAKCEEEKSNSKKGEKNNNFIFTLTAHNRSREKTPVRLI